jgi:hypothetical protein
MGQQGGLFHNVSAFIATARLHSPLMWCCCIQESTSASGLLSLLLNCRAAAAHTNLFFNNFCNLHVGARHGVSSVMEDSWATAADALPAAVAEHAAGEAVQD